MREADGALETALEEARAMGIDAGLVVLSACETAGGRVTRGEGVIGLGRALLAAGAGGVVASLWRVPDPSTRKFMETFYRTMVGEREPASSALRRARLELMDGGEFSHPFYWAAFVLVGSDRTPRVGGGQPK